MPPSQATGPRPSCPSVAFVQLLLLLVLPSVSHNFPQPQPDDVKHSGDIAQQRLLQLGVGVPILNLQGESQPWPSPPGAPG